MLPTSHRFSKTRAYNIRTRVLLIGAVLTILVICVVYSGRSDDSQLQHQVYSLSNKMTLDNLMSAVHQCPAHQTVVMPSIINSMTPLNILVTGGAGYIGSHMTLLLLGDSKVKHNVVIIDNLSRGSMQQIHNLEQHVDKSRLTFVRGDIGDEVLVYNTLMQHKIEIVIHFAGYAYASESVEHPLVYYNNIVTATTNMLHAMERASVHRLVYSSSSAVYGAIADEQCDVPLREDSPTTPSSPYGDSKLMAEHVIRAYAKSQHLAKKPFSVAMLRYFNVIGADAQLRVGPLPKQQFANYGRIVDSCFNAAHAGADAMRVYGDDYKTVDGSAVRDYIHVSDLVDAHYKVIRAVTDDNVLTYNVGIGQAFSVQQIVAACRQATGYEVQVDIQPRRLGDPPLVQGDPANLIKHLQWKPEHTDIVEMITSAWNWRMKAQQLQIVDQ